MYYTVYFSHIGDIYLYSDGEKITKMSINVLYDGYINNNDLYVFKVLRNYLDNYFNKLDNIDIDEYLDYSKLSTFQKNVLNEVKKVKFGVFCTYKEIGDKVKNVTNKNVSYQAVGSAIKNNPFPIVIPCHRIVGRKNIYFYAYGEIIKKKLFEHEKKS